MKINQKFPRSFFAGILGLWIYLLFNFLGLQSLGLQWSCEICKLLGFQVQDSGPLCIVGGGWGQWVYWAVVMFPVGACMGIVTALFCDKGYVLKAVAFLGLFWLALWVGMAIMLSFFSAIRSPGVWGNLYLAACHIGTVFGILSGGKFIDIFRNGRERKSVRETSPFASTS